MKRDVVPTFVRLEPAKPFCRCQIVELCCHCHCHSFNRMISRRSAKENCVPREPLCSQCYHTSRIDSVEGVWRRLEAPIEGYGKALGSAFGCASSLGLYSRADRCQADDWLLKRAWRVLKGIRAGCFSTPFALNREPETSENFWKSCRLVLSVKCMPTATSSNEPSMRTVVR